MSLLDNVRQTLTDVTESVMEQGKQLSSQTQLQVNIKKLQLERAKRIHELGKQTYQWYQGGNLAVSGQVPPGLTQLCRELDDIEHQMRDQENQLEQLKLQAAQSAAPDSPPAPQTQMTITHPPATVPPVSPAPGAATTTSADAQVAANPHATQVLNDDPFNPNRSGPGAGA